MLIAITGATGFIGAALLAELNLRGFFVRAIVRSGSQSRGPLMHLTSTYLINDITTHIDYSEALSGVSCVVHCAARAHVIADDEDDILAAYRKVNVEGTLKLAEQAVKFGVKRFIFISSIGVNGVETCNGKRFTVDDAELPVEAYAISKLEAEKGLLEIGRKHNLEVVIIRPPLVYGDNAKGNVARLLRLARTGFPLPLGSINNKRSMIGIENLVDFIICCVEHKRACGRTFMVSDGEDISTSDLLRRIRFELGFSNRLLPIPVPVLQVFAKLFARDTELKRIIGSLQVDDSYARQILGWIPPVTLYDGIRFMVHGKSNITQLNPKLNTYIRIIDFILSAFCITVGSPLLLIIFLIGLLDTGVPIFKQVRLGRNKEPFVLFKFRTMRIDTVEVATHLVAASSVTKIGKFLRRTKIDELPQLWNVLRGEMSLVGPRPGLLNQYELTQEREKLGIYNIRPGITGLAQVSKIDMSTPKLLAETDRKMIDTLSVKSYFLYITKTISGSGRGDRVANN
jgi:nucleoside-diphosphate-sugar epimerase/lipopolysaccharide/colanic/teichoic acid biosynthesis glycosyltransferase